MPHWYYTGTAQAHLNRQCVTTLVPYWYHTWLIPDCYHLGTTLVPHWYHTDTILVQYKLTWMGDVSPDVKVRNVPTPYWDNTQKCSFIRFSSSGQTSPATVYLCVSTREHPPFVYPFCQKRLCPHFQIGPKIKRSKYLHNAWHTIDHVDCGASSSMWTVV